MPTVSTALPKIPYGEFSSVRFQGRYVRRGLPVDCEVFASCGLRPSFVLIACRVFSLHCVRGRGALGHLRSSDFCRSAPGALAPVRVIVSRSIITYLAPCAPLAGTLRFRLRGLYEMPSLCVFLRRLGDPRVDPCFRWRSLSACRPLGPQEVHWLYAPSSFASDAGLRPEEKVSALPKSPPSDSRGGLGFRGLTTVRFRYNLPTCSPSCRS
jgi:hypothetical protein